MKNYLKTLYGITSEDFPFIALMVFYALVIYSNMFIGYNQFDEGATLYASLRAFNGELPYRDFWAFYLPGQYYIIALIYKLFSVSLMPVRIFGALINFLLPALVYLLTLKVSGKKQAFTGALLTAFSMSIWGPSYAYGSTIAVFCAFVSLYFFIGHLSSRNAGKLLLAGAIAGLTLFIRQDLGVYLFVACLAVLLVSVEGRKQAFKYILAFCFVLGAAMAYFAVQCGLETIFQHTFVFPFYVWRPGRHIEFPALTLRFGVIPFYLPLFILAAVSGFLADSWFRLRAFAEKEAITLAIAVTAMLFANYTLMRADGIHLLPVSAAAYILVPFVLKSCLELKNKYMGLTAHSFVIFLVIAAMLSYYGLAIRRLPISLWYLALTAASTAYLLYSAVREINAADLPKKWIIKDALLMFTAVILFQFCRFPLSKISPHVLLGINHPYTAPSAIPRSRGIYLTTGSEDSTRKTVEYIKARTSPTEKIFVGNARHDSMGMNNILFYFLSERQCATRYQELHTGVATIEPVQKEIAEELASKHIRYIVIDRFMMDDGPDAAAGSKYLDIWIHSRYKKVFSSGQFDVLYCADPRRFTAP